MVGGGVAGLASGTLLGALVAYGRSSRAVLAASGAIGVLLALATAGIVFQALWMARRYAGVSGAVDPPPDSAPDGDG
jgi:hypothetical protein